MRKILYRSIIVILWGALFYNAFGEYRIIKKKDIPLTTLEFEALLHDDAGDGEKGSFYFDTGRGFNQEQVASFSYTADMKNSFNKYSVQLLTRDKVKQIRFDPLENKGTIEIRNLVIKKYKEKKVDFQTLTVKKEEMHEIGNIDFSPNLITIEATGVDPYFVIIGDFTLYEKK